MEERSNRYLAQAPIGPLMLKFAVPCTLSLLVSSLYNIVDQIFIGCGVGYLGNGATNVVFPITIIALALALMIGDGCAAYLSLCQGQGDAQSAHRSVGNALVLLLGCSAVLVAIFALGRDGILASFGATENNLAYAVDYFNVILIGIPFFVLTNGLNSVIRADGSPKFAMASTLVGCVINVILDPIAIFVLHWGGGRGGLGHHPGPGGFRPAGPVVSAPGPVLPAVPGQLPAEKGPACPLSAPGHQQPAHPGVHRHHHGG